MPAPNPTTLKRVEMASPFANKSLRLPSLANDEYIGNLVALAATTANPWKLIHNILLSTTEMVMWDKTWF